MCPAKQHAKHFTSNAPGNPQQTKEISFLLSSFFRWRNWGLGRSHSLWEVKPQPNPNSFHRHLRFRAVNQPAQVTQLLSGRIRNLTGSDFKTEVFNTIFLNSHNTNESKHKIRHCQGFLDLQFLLQKWWTGEEQMWSIY